MMHKHVHIVYKQLNIIVADLSLRNVQSRDCEHNYAHACALAIDGVLVLDKCTVLVDGCLSICLCVDRPGLGNGHDAPRSRWRCPLSSAGTCPCPWFRWRQRWRFPSGRRQRLRDRACLRSPLWIQPRSGKKINVVTFLYYGCICEIFLHIICTWILYDDFFGQKRYIYMHLFLKKRSSYNYKNT